jgi:hypothetical protein
MIDTGKSLDAGSVTFSSITAASIYYAESSDEFAPRLMTGDAEGYRDSVITDLDYQH